MVPHVLQTRALYESHTGAHLAELLSKVLQEWQITNKDVALVSYNASNMVVTAQVGKFPHVRCFAHSLNLASQPSFWGESDVSQLYNEPPTEGKSEMAGLEKQQVAE